MALDRAEIQLVVTGDGAVGVLQRASEATDDVRQKAQALAETEARLNLQLREVEKALRDAQKAYLDAGEGKEKFRREALANVTGLQEERKQLRENIKAVQDQQRALSAGTQTFGGATQAVSQLGYALSDASSFAYGFRTGMQGIGNNIPGLIQGFVTLRQQTGSWRAAAQGLLGVLAGPAGIVAAVSLLTTLAVMLGPKLTEMFETAAGRARRLREDVQDLFDELVTFQGTDFELGVVITSEAEARQQIQAMRADLVRLRGEEKEYQRQVAEGTQTVMEYLPGLGATYRKVLDEHAQAAQAQLETTREEIARVEGQLAAAEQASEERFQKRQERDRLLRHGIGEDINAYRERVAAEREAEREAERLQREAESARERGARDLARRLEATEELIGTLRVEAIEDARARELAAAEKTYRERLEVAGDNAVAIALVEEVYWQQVQGINAQYARQAIEAERAFQDELAALRRERARIEGADEVAQIDAQLTVLDVQLLTLEEGTEAYRAAYLERERLRNALTEAIITESDRAADEEIRNQDRVLNEAKRALEERRRAVEGFFLRFADALDGALRYERRFSDASVALTRDRFEEEERRLRESLERQEIDQRAFHLRMRALTEERAAFEREVAEDQADAMTRLALATTAVLKEAAIEAIKAALAKAAAEEVYKVVTAIPFPANLLAAGGAIAAIFALEGAIRSAAGFASGGFVGQRGEAGADTVPAMLGRGEAVLNRHQQRYVEDALRQTYGFGLDGLFSRVRTPHYAGLQASVRALATPPARFATGGFAAPAASPLGSDSAVDALAREVRAMRREMGEREMHVALYASRRVAAELVEGGRGYVEQKRVTNPLRRTR